MGAAMACLVLLPSFRTPETNTRAAALYSPTETLKKEAFQILETKCNVCHRKQNPFLVFNEKNMVKRAPKIYKVVFVEQRMPLGNALKLTNEEYTILENWLLTHQIF